MSKLARMANLTRKFLHSPYPAISPTRPELSTNGKTVCITGGGTGIGFACAEAFAQSGAQNVIVTSRTAKVLSDAEQKLSAKYPKSKFCALATDVEATFKKLADTIGPIDIFVANAGYAPKVNKIQNIDMSDFRRAVETNLVGTYICAKYFALQASSAKDPVFINMSTGMAHTPPRLPLSGYGASKAAAAKAIEFLAYERPEI